MKVAIIGYGEQGRSAAEYWLAKGAEVTICDQDTSIETPENTTAQLGIRYLDNLHNFDLIVRSPSVHPSVILDGNQEYPEVREKITSNTNEFFRVCPAPIIGVTGTKGKGTTSSLIAKILETAGRTVHLGGNIGTPPLDLLKKTVKDSDIVVLELANFQLIDLMYSPKIAVCLMIVEEHLDWHKSFFEYVNSKKQIFAHQNADCTAIYNANNIYSTEIASSSEAHVKIGYDVPAEGTEPTLSEGVILDGHHIKIDGHTVSNIKDVQLPGRHNLENVSAAIAATWELIDHKKDVIKKALKDFKGLPHRLETVGTYNHVTYVDDSFGTTPSTAIVALKALKQPKIIILGGSDKGTSYQPLVEELTQQNIKHIIAIGETGPAIIELYKNHPKGANAPFTIFDSSKSMQNIVQTATEKADKGDVVLLSTASASFGMFKNYKDRGEQFKQAVATLAKK